MHLLNLFDKSYCLVMQARLTNYGFLRILFLLVPYPPQSEYDDLGFCRQTDSSDLSNCEVFLLVWACSSRTKVLLVLEPLTLVVSRMFLSNHDLSDSFVMCILTLLGTVPFSFKNDSMFM